MYIHSPIRHRIRIRIYIFISVSILESHLGSTI